ncbi:MAG: SAM-dependent methyltransferase [Actinomycetales bacterium]
MTSRAEQIFSEVFESLPRQGPGNLASTSRALSLCSDLPPAPRILDLGCGSGAQTMHLAALTSGTILAVDAHQPLVERLENAITEHALAERVTAQIADMASLALPAQSVDLVWSEGALYHLGLDAAVPMCAGWLQPGGYLVFTEAVWRTADPPAQARELFADYPGMGRISDVLAVLAAQELLDVGHFDLPAEAWWDDFYTPLEDRVAALRAGHADDPEALEALDQVAREPDLFRRLGEHYGYTFFVAQRST